MTVESPKPGEGGSDEKAGAPEEQPAHFKTLNDGADFTTSPGPATRHPMDSGLKGSRSMSAKSKRQLLITMLRENAQQGAVATIGPRLSQREVDNLGRLARQKAKVKKQDLSARTTHLIADTERCLATRFSADDARWRDWVDAINREAAEFNAHIAALARESGFPESFAPAICVGWSSRGENATASRRAELRRVVKSRYEAEQKKAELEIDRELTNYLELLTRETLTSDRAVQLLEELKPLEALLPPIDLDELRIAPLEKFFDRWSTPSKAITAETLALESSDKGAPNGD